MSLTMITRVTLFDAVLINAAGTAESGAVPLQYVSRLEGLDLKVSSVSGTADVKVQYAVSPDNTNFSDYGDNPNITASTLLANPTAPEGFNAYPLPTPMAGYIKFKITGIAANPADTLATGYLIMREGEA
jgi:hypothetical protein